VLASMDCFFLFFGTVRTILRSGTCRGKGAKERNLRAFPNGNEEGPSMEELDELDTWYRCSAGGGKESSQLRHRKGDFGAGNRSKSGAIITDAVFVGGSLRNRRDVVDDFVTRKS